MLWHVKKHLCLCLAMYFPVLGRPFAVHDISFKVSFGVNTLLPFLPSVNRLTGSIVSNRHSINCNGYAERLNLFAIFI